MKVSDYIVKHLAAQGVTHVFELAGGMLAHLLDSFAQVPGAPKLVSCHHEQGAGFAAEGMARMTGIPGVAMGTSGPGATNLLTAIGSAYFDSTPMVFITGSVNRNEMKGGRGIRQLGFQETDIVAMAQPVTKLAMRVTDPYMISAALGDAFRIALVGRPGPVLLDIPLDVQGAEFDSYQSQEPKHIDVDLSAFHVQPSDVDAVFAALHRSGFPLVLVGGGVRTSQAMATARVALECLDVPVVNSLMGTDVLGHGHPLRVGMIGSYGNRWANQALAECDFLLVLGSRLDIRQTGTDVKGFGARKIIQVDIDASEMNNRVTGVHAVFGDLESFCRQVNTALKVTPTPTCGLWKDHIKIMKARWPSTKEISPKGINPNAFMERLGEVFRDASAFVVDVGQHQMWAAQSLAFRTGQRFITSGGMGAMGFALPAAIGVALARPNAKVVVIAGDGGFQLNIQELETIRYHGLPIKMVVLNNRSHGMVRQFQDSYFGGRRQSTVNGYSAPDFVAVARAYGIVSRFVSEERAVPMAIDWLDGVTGPALLEVDIDVEANVYPKLAFGRPLSEMEPNVKPAGMEST